MGSYQVKIGESISDDEFQKMLAPQNIKIGESISDKDMQMLDKPESISTPDISIGQAVSNDELESLMKPEEKVSSWLGDFGRDMLKGTSRAAGVGIGIVNAPAAFIWGSQAEQFKDSEEYNKLPFWKQALVSTKGGLESAYESAFEKGSFGTMYGEYYKEVRGGKSIEDDLPEGLKWSAPTLEFLANIVGDPVISIGSAASVAKLKFPKGWTGKIPKGVMNDLNKLEEADKAVLQSKLLETLKRRKEYMQWSKEKAAMAPTKPTGPEAARKLIKPVKKEIPALTKLILEKQKLVKAPKPKPPVTEETISSVAIKVGDKTYEGVSHPSIIDEFGLDATKIKESQIGFITSEGRYVERPEASRITKIPKTQFDITAEELKLKPAPGKLVPKEVLAKIEGKLVKGEKAILPTKAGGVVLGIEEDEKGNITYDVQKGLMGAVGGMVAGKIKPINVKRFTNTMKKNPAWAKVASGIGKPSKDINVKDIASKGVARIFDRFIALKPVSEATYKEARTYSAYKDQAILKIRPLAEALKPVKKDEFIFATYTKAHRDLTRAERGIPNPGDVSVADAKQAIKEIETHWTKSGKNVKDLRSSRDAWNQWTHDHILWEAYDSGMISKTAYDDIVKNNKWYATYDVLEHMAVDTSKLPSLPSKEFFSVSNQKIIRTMIGTKKLIDDPIEATLRKFGEAQTTYAKNKVASTLVEDPGMKDLLQPVAMSKKEFAIMKNKGLNPVMTGAWEKKSFDTINRFKDGRLERYIAPKEIAEAMKQLTPYQAPRVVQAYNTIFRATATTLSLPFTIGNAARDAFMAYCSTPVYKAKDIVGKFQRDWVKGAWEGVKFEIGKKSLVDDYLKSGGGFGYAGSEAFERTTVISKSALKTKLFEKSLAQKGVTVITSPLKLMEKVNSIVELAPRIGTFERAMKLGYTEKDAAIIARQATIDFNRGGTWTKVVNQFVPFLNARVQARVVLAEGLKRDPKGTLAKMFTSAVVPGATLYAWNRLYYSDLYDDIPEYVKSNYFTFIYGQTENEKGKTVPKYFVVAKGDVGQIALNPIEFGLEQAHKKHPRKLNPFLINFLSDMSPVEFSREGKLSASKAAGGLLPPIVKGPIEDWANLKFYHGTEIVPYYMGKSKPPELQYKELTPPLYKWLGNKTGVSPLRLQNYASSILTGYGREGLSPSAMLRGVQGRIIKTQGGEIESQAFVVIKDIEQGYTYTRAYAEEMLQSGDKVGAFNLMNDWNSGLKRQVVEFNKRFRKYDIVDKGGLIKSYTFTPLKKKNLIKKRINKAKNRSYLDKKLSRR